VKAPPGLATLLLDRGCTTAYVMERANCSRSEALKLLSSLGAGRWGHNGYWRLRSVARLERAEKALAKDHSGQSKHAGDGRPWHAGRRP
jgi:hypothetical protein